MTDAQTLCERRRSQPGGAAATPRGVRGSSSLRPIVVSTPFATPGAVRRSTSTGPRSTAETTRARRRAPRRPSEAMRAPDLHVARSAVETFLPACAGGPSGRRLILGATQPAAQPTYARFVRGSSRGRAMPSGPSQNARRRPHQRDHAFPRRPTARGPQPCLATHGMDRAPCSIGCGSSGVTTQTELLLVKGTPRH